MKTVLAIILMIGISPFALAAKNYTFIPTQETDLDCQRLKLVGSFRLVPYSRSGGGWVMVFDSGARQILNKKSTGYYLSEISCSFGCSGYSKVWLNLNSKSFYYWNSIERKHPDYCRGTIR
jgi:hypothetical protein